MLVLADIEPKVIFVIVAIVVAVIGQWFEAQKKKQAQGEQPPAPPRRPPLQPNNMGESEQERLRRFLENLGVPAPAPQAPPRVQPAPRPVAPPTPAPHPFAQPMPAAKRVVPAHARPPVRNIPRAMEPQPESTKPSRPLEESTNAYEQVAEQYEAMAKGVVLSQMDQPPAPAAAVLTLERPQNTLNTALRAMLASPQNLRAALLAREILGPPKSLAE